MEKRNMVYGKKNDLTGGRRRCTFQHPLKSGVNHYVAEEKKIGREGGERRRRRRREGDSIVIHYMLMIIMLLLC